MKAEFQESGMLDLSKYLNLAVIHLSHYALRREYLVSLPFMPFMPFTPLRKERRAL